MPGDGDVFVFSPMMQTVTVRLDTLPHWLQIIFVLVTAFFAASLLVGFFRQITASLLTHKDSL